MEYMIHDDYYLHYGVENKSISQIYLGVSTTNQRKISMKSMSLKGLSNLQYKDYCKESYHIVKTYWENSYDS